jgi:hypothetical protein
MSLKENQFNKIDKKMDGKESIRQTGIGFHVTF